MAEERWEVRREAAEMTEANKCIRRRSRDRGANLLRAYMMG